MITVSLIQEYLYCPLKVCMEIDNLDIQNNSFITSKILREGHIGFEELIKRNLWTLKGEMSVKGILKNLFKDVPEFLEAIYMKYEDDFIDEEADTIFERLKDDLKFNSWLIAIKSQKLLKTGISGSDLVDILFPPCLIEFRIEDKEHGLLGQIDKIEIIDGVYYPIKNKTKLPPSKGVWLSDAIQVTAYAFLMENEFNKEIPVGFINYLSTGSRKPVLINTPLREKFIDVFNEVVAIIYDGSVPKIVQNIKKCRACNYKELCEERMTN